MSLDVLFPAHAGMNRAAQNSGLPIRAVPRTRGDEPQAFCYVVVSSPCSPHTRG